MDADITDLALNPVHEKGDVLIGGQRRGLLVLGSVLPEVLELGTAGHGRARRVGALLADGSVNQVDPVEEVDNVNCGVQFIEVISNTVEAALWLLLSFALFDQNEPDKPISK
jgi:hypothetical protein